MTPTPDQLHNAIELGGATGDPELSSLARLAGRLAYLQAPAPPPAASRRMAERFEAVMAGESHRRLLGWLALPAPRLPGQQGLVQRFAAGALVLSLLGGATSATTGVSPLEVMRAAAQVAGSLAANLAPHQVVLLGDAGPAPASPAIEDGQAPGSADAGPPAAPDPAETPPASASAGEGPQETPTPTPATPSPTSGSPSPVASTPTPKPSRTPAVATPTQGPAIPRPQPTPGSPNVSLPASPTPAGGGTPSATPTPSPTPSTTPSPPTPGATATPAGTPTPAATPHEEEEEDDEDSPEGEHEEEEGHS